MKNRVQQAKEKVLNQDVGAFIIASNDNKNYLVGFEDMSQYTGVDSFLVLTKGKDYLIVEYADDERAAKTAPDCKVLALADKLPIEEIIKNIADEENIKSFAFEAEVFKHRYIDKFQETMADKKFIPVFDIVQKMRSVKDSTEIEKIAKAVLIGDEAFKHVIGMVKPGAVEKDIAWEIEAFSRKEMGAEELAFTTIVASGANSALPHGLATDKVIEYGDFVTLDLGLKYQGYCGDMTRTVIVGEASEKQKEIYAIVLEAQLAGVKAAKAGMKAKDLDKVARDIITNYGYGKEFGHELGHSMGLRCHEIPMVGDYDDTILVPGMIVTIEPGIYIPGWGGCRIEDTVVIEENGCRILTKTSKELLIV